MRLVLIDAQTDAKTVTMEVQSDATVVVKGLLGAETIPVNILIGSTYEPLIEEGEAVTFTATATQMEINAKGDYQFVKGSTSGAVTLQVTY